MLSQTAAIWFLIFTSPIAIWAAWSDLARMKIPNKSVIALFAVYAVLGLIFLPLNTYLWGYLNLVVILAIGFVLSATGMFGAGDAKFAAAMAPFFIASEWRSALLLFTVVLILAFLLHRGFRAIPAVRQATPNWESWERTKDFPMGLALSGTLIVYFLMAIFMPA